jgi:hypothetical protein
MYGTNIPGYLPPLPTSLQILDIENNGVINGSAVISLSICNILSDMWIPFSAYDAIS